VKSFKFLMEILAGKTMNKIGLGIIGVGWIGGMRAFVASSNQSIGFLGFADIDLVRVKSLARKYDADFWTSDYKEILGRDDIEAIIISTTPEETHYPIALEALKAGKHVLVEKPMGLNINEANELIEVAKESKVFLTVGYTKRFNQKYSYAKKCIQDKALGEICTAFANTNLARSLGKKIAGRVNLTPITMEATHDIDYLLWCCNSRPIRVYSQHAWKLMKKKYNAPDSSWIIITLENGTVCVIGANWTIIPGWPHYSTQYYEFIGTKGNLILDNTHRDLILRTEKETFFPLSPIPGEIVGLSDFFEGPLKIETDHFIKCVSEGIEPIVTFEQAKIAMQVTIAADLSAEKGHPIDLPLD
jgi:predicted dehydrogenase